MQTGVESQTCRYNYDQTEVTTIASRDSSIILSTALRIISWSLFLISSQILKTFLPLSCALKLYHDADVALLPFRLLLTNL